MICGPVGFLIGTKSSGESLDNASKCVCFCFFVLPLCRYAVHAFCSDQGLARILLSGPGRDSCVRDPSLGAGQNSCQEAAGGASSASAGRRVLRPPTARPPLPDDSSFCDSCLGCLLLPAPLDCSSHGGKVTELQALPSAPGECRRPDCRDEAADK